MKKIIACLIVASLITIPILVIHAQQLGTQEAVDTDLHYKYLIYLPKNYGETEKKWPTIFFLHGAGERGDDLNLVKVHGPPKIVNSSRSYERMLGTTLGDFDFIVVSPQCPSSEWWLNDYLIHVMEEVLAGYAVDTGRIYLTGLSMGGFGTWSFASEYPHLFAAIAPICGSGDAMEWPSIESYTSMTIPAAVVENLVDIPVWAFHGESDSVVRIEEDEKTVEELRELGGDVEFTRYPSTGHDCWTKTYNNPELYQWFLQHSIKAESSSARNAGKYR